MSAAKAVEVARAAGVELDIDGGDLVLAAAAPPSPEIIDLLSCHKPAIIAWLRPGQDGWSAEDWQVFFDQRAGAANLVAGLPPQEAKARAFACCVVQWMNRNGVRSDPARCLFCGGGDHQHDPLLPHGIDLTGRAWLHA